MTNSRELHKRAANAYRAWAEGMNIDRVWDELSTFEQCSWRDVVRSVNEENARLGVTPCHAVTLIFGPGVNHCVESPAHDGAHRDSLGREWFNLSESIRESDNEK